MAILIKNEIEYDDDERITDDPMDERCEDDDWLRCGCRYCFCSVRTKYGETCDSCGAGAHQG